MREFDASWYYIEAEGDGKIAVLACSDDLRISTWRDWYNYGLHDTHFLCPSFTDSWLRQNTPDQVPLRLISQIQHHNNTISTIYPSTHRHSCTKNRRNLSLSLSVKFISDSGQNSFQCVKLFVLQLYFLIWHHASFLSGVWHVLSGSACLIPFLLSISLLLKPRGKALSIMGADNTPHGCYQCLFCWSHDQKNREMGQWRKWSTLSVLALWFRGTAKTSVLSPLLGLLCSFLSFLDKKFFHVIYSLAKQNRQTKWLLGRWSLYKAVVFVPGTKLNCRKSLDVMHNSLCCLSKIFCMGLKGKAAKYSTHEIKKVLEVL